MDYKARKYSKIKETHTDLQLMCYSDALLKENINVNVARPYLLEDDKNIQDIDLSNSKDTIKKTLNNFIMCVNNKKFEGSNKPSGFCKECPYKNICGKSK
jgi:CRISPR/Cas system-associated exonuclease Cas4 (RecB family)